MKEILIVDDEFDLTSTIRAILQHRGYRTEVCSTGREALECIKDKRPDLVLLDVMIPLGNGYDVLDAMRRNPELSETPVVLMNAVPPPEGRAVKWQAFLKKPLSIGRLIEMVEGLIGAPAGPDIAEH